MTRPSIRLLRLPGSYQLWVMGGPLPFALGWNNGRGRYGYSRKLSVSYLSRGRVVLCRLWHCSCCKQWNERSGKNWEPCDCAYHLCPGDCLPELEHVKRPPRYRDPNYVPPAFEGMEKSLLPRFDVRKPLTEAGWEPVGDPVDGTQRWEPIDRVEEKEA